MDQSVESFVGAYFAKLDGLIGGLTKKAYWTLWVGAIAIALSLVAHTPGRSQFRVGKDWTHDVIRMQVAHPFTPIDLEQFNPDALKTGEFGQHLDKIAFRISIPLIGQALHTGAASFLVLSYVAGFLFFPMLAHVGSGIFRDRVTATYVTFAFALSWVGSHFFNDNSGAGFALASGDGFAWACLLASIYFRHPVLIFGLILTASFTDERALVGSAGALLYWLCIDRQRGRDALIAIVAAWVSYFVLRVGLACAFGLKTGTSGWFLPAIFLHHVNVSFPYRVLTVFQGLWLWFAVGAIALYLRGRSVVLVGFVATFGCIALLSLSLWDIRRTLGYALLLLPVAWQAGGLEQATERAIARGCFIFGLCLIEPINTVLYRCFANISAIPL